MTMTPARLTRVAVVANIVAAGLLGAAYAFSHRLFGTADEMVHLDYAYQVWTGQLPVFEHGLTIVPGFGFRAPTQWTGQHPPLFYVVAAPVVGPLIDSGHYVAAGYAGRAVSALFACTLVAAVMWTAHAIAPQRRALWLSAGTLAAAHPAVVFIAGVTYNDNAFVTFAALLIGCTALMLRTGGSWPRFALFAAAASGAMLSRSSAIVVVGICGSVLLVSFVCRRPRQWRWVGGLAGSAVVVVLASGWFYLRNRRLTGNLLGAQPAENVPYLAHRVARPFHEVVLDPAIWREWHFVWGYDVLDSTLVAALLVGVPVVVAVVLTLLHLRRARRPG